MAVDYIPRTRELYHPTPAYRWANNRALSVPWTPLAKPLPECRVALLSTGGVYRRDQEPFHFKDDTSLRPIPATTSTSDLAVAHFGYPTADARKDPNCVFPLDRLRELAADGVIGEVAPTAITCMGGVYSQRRVKEQLIPEIEGILREQDIDLFYLVPA